MADKYAILLDGKVVYEVMAADEAVALQFAVADRPDLKGTELKAEKVEFTEGPPPPPAKPPRKQRKDKGVPRNNPLTKALRDLDNLGKEPAKRTRVKIYHVIHCIPGQITKFPTKREMNTYLGGLKEDLAEFYVVEGGTLKRPTCEKSFQLEKV